METSRLILIVLSLAAAVPGAPGFAAPARSTGLKPVPTGIEDVKVATDTSIDCSSIPTIARDLYKNVKTDEEKAIATWYFVRRMLYHWPHIPTWDSIDLINSYGFGLCGYQSTIYCQIAQAGGFKARTMHPTNHVIAEIFYGDAWHMFDCQVGWYALRKDKSAVASVEELKADDALVADAVKDGRASKPYFQCRDNPGSGTNYAKTAKVGGSPGIPKNKLTINLRRGESLTRNWSNEGKPWFQLKDNNGFVSPAHCCTPQAIDADDPVNWPFWKPYAQVARADGDKVTYGSKRYYGNGRLVYEPSFRSDAWKDGLAKDAPAEVQTAAGGLHPQKTGTESSVTFALNSPYIATDAWLDARAIRRTDKDALSVYVKTTNRGDWKKVYEADKTGELKLENVSLKDQAWESHGCLVKFVFKADANATDVGLRDVKFTTVFMNNMYALPYFMPGKNTLTVSAAEGADLAKNKLSLEYSWFEDGKEKTLAKTIDKLPFEATVEIPGKEIPKMKSVKLAVAP